MRSKRQQRVSDQIRKILGQLLQKEAEDPRLDGVTVMDVRIDRELMYAQVWVNSLKGEAAKDEVMGALETASGFLRRELGKQIRLQHVPELRFEWDETLEYADRIEQILADLATTRSDDNSGDEQPQ